VEEKYPGTYLHGHFALRFFLEEPLEPWVPFVTSGGWEEIDPSALVFLDIETTGLSREAGIYAFLVGLGRFEKGAFCLRQVFMRTPAEEQALLLVVADLLREIDGVVTFNGRGFDLPVLGSRYTLARMEPPWKDMIHLDLLLLARRLWRDRLPSCSLSSLEEHLLGVERDILDLPGWRIPSLYHDYLRGADGDILRPVFYHNAQDILSLVTLAVRLGRYLGDPWGDGGARHGLEYYGLGRLYEQQKDAQSAIAAYRAALLLAMPLEVREHAWKRLARLLKREGSWDEAVEIWHALVERSGEHPLYAYVELAKYYEHRCRDVRRAEAITKRAIGEYGECPAGEDLAHRLNRLQRKLEQHS
jgi:uncharacterized protein YprB with RNaseH-like and TPR domain